MSCFSYLPVPFQTNCFIFLPEVKQRTITRGTHYLEWLLNGFQLQPIKTRENIHYPIRMLEIGKPFNSVLACEWCKDRSRSMNEYVWHNLEDSTNRIRKKRNLAWSKWEGNDDSNISLRDNCKQAACNVCRFVQWVGHLWLKIAAII